MKKQSTKTYVRQAAADSSDGADWSKAVVNPLMPNLKFSTESVTLRMPSVLLHKLKMLANQLDVPYQSLMKIFLTGAVESKSQKLLFKQV